MDYESDPTPSKRGRSSRSLLQTLFALSPVALGVALLFAIGFGWFVYRNCWINVPKAHIAVLTTKIGTDLKNGQEVAPDDLHKGLQLEVLSEGRYLKNPYVWNWKVYPMVEIPGDKMGVRVRLYGEDLPYGHFIATDEKHKGIVKEVLKPGRYAINAMVIDRVSKQEIGNANRSRRSDYVEIVELWDPKVIPAGYEGIVTNLAGPMPKNPNALLVEKDHRGPQELTYKPGTYYKNPYMYRINSIDTRSQRFNLSQGKDMTFPSKDGFPISLDGIIEFSVIPETAALTYVTYNDVTDDQDGRSDISQEIIDKVIMPNARAFCRLRGSNTSAREFIGGETRTAFQKEFQKAITETCKSQGIEIVQALITKIKPPQAIAEPLRDREVNAQELKQYTQQILQQQQEAKLASEKALIEQAKKLTEADREVVEAVTLAKEEQQVALEAANRDKAVAEQKLEAAKDEAEAILARATAKAAVIGYQNEADAAGWKKAVEALGNDGEAYARYVLYQKLAPGYRNIMTNTADSPLMQVFQTLAPESGAQAAAEDIATEQDETDE